MLSYGINLIEAIIHLPNVSLGPFQTSNFTCAESNANERKP